MLAGFSSRVSLHSLFLATGCQGGSDTLGRPCAWITAQGLRVLSRPRSTWERKASTQTGLPGFSLSLRPQECNLHPDITALSVPVKGREGGRQRKGGVGKDGWKRPVQRRKRAGHGDVWGKCVSNTEVLEIRPHIRFSVASFPLNNWP